MAKKTDDIEIRNGTAQDESNAADSEKMIDTKDEAAAEQPESMTERLLRRMDEIAAENEKIREELSRTRKESAETREKAEKAAGSGSLSVYSTLIIGKNAYGVTDVEGGGLETIVKQKGSAGTADPLDQRASAGWKALKTAEILSDEYMLRIESCSSFSTAEAN